MICFAKFCLNVSFGGQIKIVEVVRTRIMDFSLPKRILQYPQNVTVCLLFFFLFVFCFFVVFFYGRQFSCQGQETFLAPSADEQTHNSDTE